MSAVALKEQEEIETTEPEALEESPEVVEETVNEESENETATEAEEDGAIDITLGEESLTSDEDTTSAPAWVKDLRKTNRELKKAQKQLERENAQLKQANNPQQFNLGKKPTFEDFDFDPDRAAEYEAALEDWNMKKQVVDNETQRTQEIQNQQNQDLNQKLASYAQAKTELMEKSKLSDFAEAEENVMNAFDNSRQAILVKLAKDPALLVYAIGKNPKRADELSKIIDPVEFGFALGQLEKDMKVTKRKAPPAPESKVTGSAPMSGSGDKALERLRADAVKTGNINKVMEYKRQLKNKT